MRAKTCCTVSLKGGTMLLRRSHSRTRCGCEQKWVRNTGRRLRHGKCGLDAHLDALMCYIFQL